MDYWSKRKIELDKSLEKDEELLKKRLSAYYDKEQTKLEKEIASFYARYGDNNILAYRNLLVSMEPEDVVLLMERMDEFFVKYPDYAKLMPVRKYIYKLNRLEGLQYSIYLQQQEIGAVTNEALTVHLAKQAEKYGKAAATAIGHGTIFNAVNKSVAETFVIADWAAGKNYSQRIWENANKLAQYLNTDFAQGVARGDSYQKLITNLKDRFANVTRRDAFRLVYTEGTYVMNEASIRVFEEQYDEYEFSPINDEKTCSVCSSLKGQRFLISDRQAGVNFPPMHPYCRCSFTIVNKDNLNKFNNNAILKPDGFDIPKEWKYKGQTELTDDLKATNPNYKKNAIYQKNCQKCVPAYEMRRRGYDVEALPTISSADIVKNRWDKVFENADVINASSNTQKSIINSLISYGDNSRVQIYVVSSDGKMSHTFVGENCNGNIYFIDPQSNSDAQYIFDERLIDFEKTKYFRIDNLNPTELIKQCCKSRKV